MAFCPAQETSSVDFCSNSWEQGESAGIASVDLIDLSVVDTSFKKDMTPKKKHCSSLCCWVHCNTKAGLKTRTSVPQSQEPERPPKKRAKTAGAADDVVLYAGGPVWALDWAPSSPSADTLYLAVSIVYDFCMRADVWTEPAAPGCKQHVKIIAKMQ